ncbi:MAG: penicillin-binding protein 2 [Deltaproteobacteria bacterium]|nr:penicillin-binding protein 2 [Deltaproteobacteria bacterium]
MIITVFVIVIISILLLRLWFLQIINGPAYRIQSENNRIHLQSIPPYRGRIMDRNGELLVDNRPSYDLYIIPEDIQDPEQLAANLKRLISLDIEQFNKKHKKAYSGRPFNPVLVKKNISREELAVIEVNGFNLPGVYVQDRPQRNYIYNTFAAHIIGYLGEINEKELKSGKYPDNSAGDYIGKTGVEGKWQDKLNGESGGMQVEVDAAGRKLETLASQKPAVPGYNINLTIDKDLQSFAESSLKDKRGTIVALDPNTGEVLAMASSPAFDPNKFVGGISTEDWNEIRNNPAHPLQNRAVASQYPPGSIFKIVVALAGLEEGQLDPAEQVFCNGRYSLGNHTYKCWGLKLGGHGSVNLQEALVNSCDIYFYKLGKKLGIDTIAGYSRMFGLGKKTNIDLHGESDGIIPDTEWKLRRDGIPWQQGETVVSAIGQSYVTVTPLQMASLISTVFNGGRIFEPRVVKRVGNDTSNIYEFAPTLHGKLGISSENIELVKQALIAVVNDPKGTGKNAKVKDITVAGKTGTAEVANQERIKALNLDGEVPSKLETHAWFVAVAPAEDPEIAISILVEHGGGGSSEAAPIAGELIRQYLKNRRGSVLLKNDV